MNKATIEQAKQAYLAKHGHKEMSLRCAMFDMDGVLFDSMKNHARAWNETMQHFGFTDFTEEEAYMHEGRTGAGTINDVSLRMFGEPASEERCHEMYEYKSACFNSLPKAERMPGAWELLQKVKASGVTPVIVTGSGQKTLLERLNRNFPDMFRPELMVTAFDVKYGKPNPEPYLMGMEKYKNDNDDDNDGSTGSLTDTNPNNFIVVENAPLGVRAGVAAGVFTIAVNTGPLPDKVLLNEGANLLFHSMQEFCDNWETVIEVLK